MRLHRLSLQAFQAFAGPEQVDFEALSQAGLFLLHGDTGAGKTTLLDAVVFALYGEGAARAGAERLRSDHAAPGIATEVELELTVRGRRVRVWRRPPQERPKLRGEGTTKDGAKVRVDELRDDGEWQGLTASLDEARDELEALLGLTREQFCQVVLLPQGAFAAFLRASSDDRRKVLETLFATERFTRAEDWLTGHRRATEHDFHTGCDGVASLAARVAQAAGVEDPPQEWEREPTTITAWVGELAVPAEAEVVTAGEALRAASTVAADAAAALQAGRASAAARDAAEAVRADLEEWQQGRGRRDAAEQTLHAAERASGLEALLAAVSERRTTLAEAAAAAEAARERLTLEDVAGVPTPGPEPITGTDAMTLFAVDGGAAAPTPVPDFDGGPAGLRGRAAALREAAGTVAAFAEAEAGLVDAVRRRAALEEEAESHARSLAAAEEELRALPARRTALEAAVSAARDAAAALPAVERDAQRAAARAQDGEQRDVLSVELTRARTAAAAALDCELEAKKAWLGLREGRLDGMAAHLASTLVPGEPCAVCGGVDHPAPAAPGDGGTVSAEQERVAGEAHDAAAVVRKQADDRATDLAERLAAVTATAGDVPLAELRALAAAVSAERRALAERAEALADAEREQQDARDDESRLTGVLRSAGESLAAARTEAQTLGLHIEEDRRALLVALAGAPDVRTRQAALARAAAAHDDAAAALDALDRAQAEAEAAGRRARDGATRAAFADVAAAQAAFLPNERRAALTAEVAAWDTGLAERRRAVRDAVLPEEEPVDVDELVAFDVVASAAKESAAGTLALARQRATALRDLHAEVDAAVAALLPVAERLQVVRGLARLADGSDASNRLRMRLSAYVLAARLEEVAAAATVRLQAMTDGRYELVHCDEASGRARRGGLDLRVVDAWTGTERPTQSLSGGETFKAALALALGLADVVTAESGGARLETLFVDEGFGSLDEQSLEEVMDVLDRLRDGGRAVGLVSHVADLRDRIPARLHVVKGRDGSSIRALLPMA